MGPGVVRSRFRRGVDSSREIALRRNRDGALLWRRPARRLRRDGGRRDRWRRADEVERALKAGLGRCVGGKNGRAARDDGESDEARDQRGWRGAEHAPRRPDVRSADSQALRAKQHAEDADHHNFGFDRERFGEATRRSPGFLLCTDSLGHDDESGDREGLPRPRRRVHGRRGGADPPADCRG